MYDPDAADQKHFVEEGIPNSSFLLFGEGKYVTLPTDQEYRVELKGLDYGSFTFDFEEKQGDEVLKTKSIQNIPVSPETTATMIIRSLDEASPLSIDADGDGEEDVALTGSEPDDISITPFFEILSAIIGNMDMDIKLKETLLKKLLITEAQLEKGKTAKAEKALDNIIKRLELEIKRNERLEKKQQRFEENQQRLEEKIEEIENQISPEEEAEDEKDMKELEKAAKKDEKLRRRIAKLQQRLQRRSARWEEWQKNHPGMKIATDDARILIYLVQGIVEKIKVL